MRTTCECVWDILDTSNRAKERQTFLSLFSLRKINSEGTAGFLSTGKFYLPGALCYLDFLFAKIKARCYRPTVRVSQCGERVGGVRCWKQGLREHLWVIGPCTSETLSHTLGWKGQRGHQWAMMLAVSQSEKFVFKYGDGCFRT